MISKLRDPRLRGPRQQLDLAGRAADPPGGATPGDPTGSATPQPRRRRRSSWSARRGSRTRRCGRRPRRIPDGRRPARISGVTPPRAPVVGEGSSARHACLRRMRRRARGVTKHPAAGPPPRSRRSPAAACRRSARPGRGEVTAARATQHHLLDAPPAAQGHVELDQRVSCDTTTESTRSTTSRKGRWKWLFPTTETKTSCGASPRDARRRCERSDAHACRHGPRDIGVSVA